MRIDVFTLFPGYFEGPLSESLLGKARARGLIDVRLHDPRDWTTDPHRVVDDAPFGGGAGMVMMPGPLFAAVEEVAPPRPLYLLSAAGRPFDQAVAAELAAGAGFSLLCGRYEGVARLVPEVMGNECSAGEESFTAGLLEYPQYTRPADFRGLTVPEVLRSGDHARVARWRRAQAPPRTRDRRPDLLAGRDLSPEETALLEE